MQSIQAFPILTLISEVDWRGDILTGVPTTPLGVWFNFRSEPQNLASTTGRSAPDIVRFSESPAGSPEIGTVVSSGGWRHLQFKAIRHGCRTLRPVRCLPPGVLCELPGEKLADARGATKKADFS